MVAQNPYFLRCRTGVGDNPAMVNASLLERRGQFSSRAIFADNPKQVTPRPEGADISRRIAGAAGDHDSFLALDNRNRGLGRDALNGPKDIAIEHNIADDRDLLLIKLGDKRERRHGYA